MPFAARIFDPIGHPGVIVGPGTPNVLINGLYLPHALATRWPAQCRLRRARIHRTPLRREARP